MADAGIRPDNGEQVLTMADPLSSGGGRWHEGQCEQPLVCCVWEEYTHCVWVGVYPS